MRHNRIKSFRTQC